MMKRILIVEDDPEMRRLIERKLTNAGFELITAASGQQALDLLNLHGLPHLAIVDINMPGMNGLEFCAIVQQYADLPVILVTAISEASTMIRAIDRFAEDYIVKPFNLDELVVRTQRLLRRINDFGYATGTVVPISDRLSVNFMQQLALIHGDAVELTPIETKILHILWRSVGHVVSNEFLLGRIWPGQEVYEDTLRVHVHRLRHKIEGDLLTEKHIVTERGQGYRLIAHAPTINRTNEYTENE